MAACNVRSDSRYHLSQPLKGKAIILCNSRFNTDTMLEEISFEDDIRNCQFVLQTLGFPEFVCHRNKTAAEMKEILRNVAAEAGVNMECFLCVILSHGKESIETGEDGIHQSSDHVWGIDETVPTKELMSPLHTPNLAGIPKIFIVIACRGSTWSQGVNIPARSPPQELHSFTVLELASTSTRQENTQPSSDMEGVEHDDDDMDLGNPASRPEGIITADIPVWNDFLLVYSTLPGYAAPQPLPYSPLINALARHASSQIDFLKVITRASCDVATDYEACGKKLMPWIASRLTKDICFNG